MCCCGKPTINGQPNAYSWDGKSYSTRLPHAPTLRDGDELLHDEPGRCGGLDCHSHHFRLVKCYGSYDVLVQHGGGDERFSLGVVGQRLVPSFDALDSNGRFWLMHTLYSIRASTQRETGEKVAQFWRKAAVEKRIKTRKLRGKGQVKVWIEPAAQVVEG